MFCEFANANNWKIRCAVWSGDWKTIGTSARDASHVALLLRLGAAAAKV
jgi:hypothetical protein